MSTDDQADEIEVRGFEFLHQERWHKARGCFEEMLSLPLDPMREVKVLRNIMGTYEKEGRITEAIDIGERALEIIDTYNLYGKTDGGYDFGYIRGCIARYRGETYPWNLVIAPLSAYFIGASIGAVIGSKIVYEGLTINGSIVLTDLRYGGAGVGALLGWLILTRTSLNLGRYISASFGLLNFILLLYILTDKNFSLGLSVIGLLFLPILLVWVFLRSK